MRPCNYLSKLEVKKYELLNKSNLLSHCHHSLTGIGEGGNNDNVQIENWYTRCAPQTAGNCSYYHVMQNGASSNYGNIVLTCKNSLCNKIKFLFMFLVLLDEFLYYIHLFQCSRVSSSLHLQLQFWLIMPLLWPRELVNVNKIRIWCHCYGCRIW